METAKQLLRRAGVRAARLSTVAKKVMREFNKMYCPSCHCKVPPGKVGRLCESCQVVCGKRILP